MENKKPVAVVVGAGPGNGAALARRFVEAGYAAAILSRHRSTLTPIENELAETRGFECDVSDPASVESAFARIVSELGEVNVLLYNAGSGVFADVETITPDQFEQAWRVMANRRSRSPCDPLNRCKTSDVAVRCFRSSPSSRVSRATSVSSVSSVAGSNLERAWTFGTLRRFGSRVFRRRPLIVWPPALERLFIGSPCAQRSILAGTGRTPEVALADPPECLAALTTTM